MSTSSSQLLADVAQLHVDSGLIHETVHGPATGTVQTEGGIIPTLANAIATLKAFNPRGAWAAGVAYAMKDLFTDGGIVYVAIVDLVSTSIATDLADGKIAIFFGISSADLESTTDPTKGDALVGVKQPFDGAIARTQHDKNAEYVTVTDFDNVDKNGEVDSTAGLIEAFSNGGEIHVPDGNYLIAAAGPDSGGVSVILRASTRITCSPKARFFTNGLDNDLITFVVDADTPDGIILNWKGGLFDQTAQKNSTVMPFTTEYPPANPGVSGTCDGLSIRGDTTVGGTPVSKIRRCVVEEVITVAGTHWHTAGGDSGIFISGCEEQHALNCVNVGNRDCGIYASSDATGVLVCRTVISDNKHFDCFHGNAVKRSLGYATVTGNYAENCVRGFLADLVAGTGFVGLDMRGNKGAKCNIFVRVNKVSGFSVRDNHFNSLGAVMDDGVTIVSINQDCIGLDVQGGTLGEVSGNTVDGLTAGAITAFATECNLLRSESYTDGTLTTRTLWRDNKGNGLRSVGTDSGDMNSFIDNVVFNALTSANMTGFGTNAWEQRQDPLTNARTFRQAVSFSDGTKAAPSISRAGQSSLGIRFAANLLALTVSSNDRFSASNTGIGFNDTAPIAKPSLGSDATDAASTQTLANNIKAALINYGLCAA